MTHHVQRARLALLLAAAGSLVALTGCFTPSRVAKMGDAEAHNVEASMGIVENAALTKYVNDVGRRLVAVSQSPSDPWTFQIVATPEPNAFALPGGHIYVSRGLLALVNSEDELAGVIGHEIGHVTANHTANRLRASAITAPISIATRIAGATVGIVSPRLGGAVDAVGQLVSTGFVVAPFSRSQENQSDEIGQTLAALAGYDPSALARFLHSLERNDTLETGEARKQSVMDYHPITPDRVRMISERAAELERGLARPIATNHAELLARLDGILVGEDPAGGVFFGNVFLHPVFDFSIAFPVGWKTVNTPEATGALSLAKDASVSLTLAASDSTLEEFVAQLARDYPELDLEIFQLNGFPAARSRNSHAAHVTLIQRGRSVFSLVGSISGDRPGQYASTFNAVAVSFEALSSSARATIMESRLRARRAHGGETPAAISERLGSSWSGEQIAVANDLRPDQTLEANQLLKVALPEPFTGTDVE